MRNPINEMTTIETRLKTLMQQKVADFTRREEILACALTGSLARGRVWEGSDLDFWGFWDKYDDAFEDGMVDGIYWEIDIQPLDWLRGWDYKRLSYPPPFTSDEFGVTPLEALWGAQVQFDQEGTLTQVVALVQRLMNDKVWLRQRGANYVRYGLECLPTLEAKDPAQAILDARRIAIVYGINAYWMKRGELLSSVIRIPERLHEHPEIQALLKQIFSLHGQPGWDAFYAVYQTLPESIHAEADPDMEREILPAVRLGMADGGLCHFRFIADGWLPLDEAWPVMGFEPDLDAQKARVLGQTKQLLELVDRR
jgi:hypothetical protein